MSNKKTILIVDDDYDYLLQQKSLLEQEGYNIITAEGVNKARIVFQENTFDAAVIDLMMEDMDSGFVLSYELKKKFPDMPVIIVTAVSSHTGIEFDYITKYEKNWIKADAIFTKPVRAEQLISEIQRLLKVNV